MIDNIEYKNTSVDLIPNDWKIIKLSDLGTTFSGLSGKNKDTQAKKFLKTLMI